MRFFLKEHGITNALNSNRCDHDLCYKMTYITVAVACLISQLYPWTPVHLSGIDEIFPKRYCMTVALKTSKLPVFKVEHLPGTHVLKQFT